MEIGLSWISTRLRGNLLMSLICRYNNEIKSPLLMLFTSYSTPSKINQYTLSIIITKEEAVKNNYLLFIIINNRKQNS